jgi:hypothetical protein
LTILISALPVQGELLTVQKSDRVKLQIKQDINDIKETKWFMGDIDDNLISIQPDNNRYNGGTHDNPYLTICPVDLKDSTIYYVCMCLYNYRNILNVIILRNVVLILLRQIVV